MVGRIDGLEKHTQKGKLRKGYTIKDDIKKAVRKLVKAKLEGKSLSDIDMVDLTPAQQELVKSFSGAKSVRQIKNAIIQYTNAVGTVARNQKFAKLKPIASKEEILKTQRLYQEQVALADEMNELDRTNEEYTGETININGKERSVYNSEGNRIAKSEQALRAFYNWFGDSKVVDSQGRPLVVYHGTGSKKYVYNATEIKIPPISGIGRNYAKREMGGNMDTISQSGTNINSDGKLYQKAFSASRVDYEHPSLEYIGTGEGNQAHGWGMYYALSKDVAEGYAERHGGGYYAQIFYLIFFI